MLGLAPDLVIAWMAVAGICSAIFGARAWAIYLAAPAAIRWVLWPLAAPLVNALLNDAIAHWWWFLPVILVAPLIAAILVARGLVDVLGLLFGQRVAGHVGGVFVTRFLDWLSGRRRGRPIPNWEPEEHE